MTFDMNNYKQLALRTKSSPTEKSQHQLIRSWSLLRDFLEEVRDNGPIVDKLKRYAIYGKDDEELEDQLHPAHPTGEKAERVRQCRDAIHALVGIVGECGETAEKLLAYIDNGGELDVQNIREEVSDKLWFLNLLAAFAGSDLVTIAGGNIRKLQKRYPQAFTLEDYSNRDTKAEMAAFENK